MLLAAILFMLAFAAAFVKWGGELLFTLFLTCFIVAFVTAVMQW